MQDLRESLLESVDNLVVHPNLLLPKLDNCFDLLDVQHCMATSAELVVHLEDPDVDVEVVHDELGQG